MTKIDIVALNRADFLFTTTIGPDQALLPSPPRDLSDRLHKPADGSPPTLFNFEEGGSMFILNVGFSLHVVTTQRIARSNAPKRR
jgi:hypothetical protein